MFAPQNNLNFLFKSIYFEIDYILIAFRRMEEIKSFRYETTKQSN